MNTLLREFVDPIEETRRQIEGCVELKIMAITPEIARRWNEIYNTGNRKVSPKHVDRLAKDMSAGRWKFTGQPIAFAKSGKMLNGQHTMLAIIKSNVTIISLVITNLDEEVMFAFDDGRKRMFSDWLRIQKTESYTTVAAITSFVSRYERNGLGGNVESVFNQVPVGILEMEEVLARNPDIQAAANFVTTKDMTKLVSPSLLGFFRWITYRHLPQLSDEFFDALRGHNPRELNPPWVLREKLRDIRSDKTAQARSQYILALTIRAWNKFVEGGEMKIIRQSAQDKFPEIRLSL